MTDELGRFREVGEQSMLHNVTGVILQTLLYDTLHKQRLAADLDHTQKKKAFEHFTHPTLDSCVKELVGLKGDLVTSRIAYDTAKEAYSLHLKQAALDSLEKKKQDAEAKEKINRAAAVQLALSQALKQANEKTVASQLELVASRAQSKKKLLEEENKSMHTIGINVAKTVADLKFAHAEVEYLNSIVSRPRTREQETEYAQAMRKALQGEDQAKAAHENAQQSMNVILARIAEISSGGNLKAMK